MLELVCTFLIGLGHPNRLGRSNLYIANVLLRSGEGVDCTFAVSFGIKLNIDIMGVDGKRVEFIHINVPARRSCFHGRMCLVA